MQTITKLLVGLAAILAVAALAACGGSSGSSSSSSSASGDSSSASTQKPANIAYLTYVETDYVMQENAGMESVVKPLGGSVERFSANFDPQKQIQQCNDAITSGRFNAIVLAPVDSGAAVPCVKAAKAANIPVLGLELPTGGDIMNPKPQVDGIVGNVVGDNASNAAGIKELTQKACEGVDPCNVIVETVAPGDPFSKSYVDAIKSIGGNVKVVQEIPAGYDPATLQKGFADALSAHPDASVFVSAADTQAMAVLDQIDAAGMKGKIKIIGNGGSREGAKAVADGTFFGTLGNWPYQNGVAAAKMAEQAVNGETVDPQVIDVFTISTPFVITKDNVAEFKPEWGAK